MCVSQDPLFDVHTRFISVLTQRLNPQRLGVNRADLSLATLLVWPGAMPAGNPIRRMRAGPLREIRLRPDRAALQRAGGLEQHVELAALAGVRQQAGQQYQVDQVHRCCFSRKRLTSRRSALVHPGSLCCITMQRGAACRATDRQVRATRPRRCCRGCRHCPPRSPGRSSRRVPRD